MSARPDPAGDVPEAVVIADLSIFYEVRGGVPVRRMEPMEMAFRRSGSGAPRVVLLHSVGGGSGMDALRAALAGDVEVVALDLRGFGASARPVQDYAVAVWAEDAITLLEALGGPPPVVYGHGAGAAVALALAGRLPLAGVAVSGVATAAGEPGALTAVAEAGDRGEDLALALGDLLDAPPFDADLTPEVVSRAIRAWQAAAHSPPGPPPATPALIVSGEDDRLTPAGAPGGAEALADERGARHVRLPGGHELPALRPDDVAEALTRWIDEEVRA